MSPDGSDVTSGLRPRYDPKTHSIEFVESDVTTNAWAERVKAVVDQAHAENWGGEHREGFCKACANAYIVAQHAVPGGPGTAPEGGLQRGIDALADAYSDIAERDA